MIKLIEILLEENKNINTVYLDMDGVIVDFDKKAKEVISKYSKPKDKSESKKLWNSISRFQKEGGEFWYEAPPMKDYKKLVDYLYKNPNITVKVLSATGNPNFNAEEQKKKWLDKYLGNYNIEPIFVRLSNEKAKYASEDALLIDDRIKSTEPFKEAGGNVILHKSVDDTIKKLKEIGI